MLIVHIHKSRISSANRAGAATVVRRRSNTITRSGRDSDVSFLPCLMTHQITSAQELGLDEDVHNYTTFLNG